MNELITKLGFLTDENSKKRAIGALNDVNKAIQVSGQQAVKTSSTLSKLAQGNREVADSVDDMVNAIRSETKAMQEADAQAQALLDTVQEMIRSQPEFNDVELGQGIQNIGGALTSVGAGGVGGALSSAGDFIALAEELPRIKESFRDMTELIGNSGLGGAIQQMIPNLSTAGVGLASLGALAVAAGVAIVAFNVLLADDIKLMEQQRASMQATIDARRQVDQEIASGMTTEEAQQQLELLQRQRDAEAANVERLRGAYASMDQKLEETFGILGGVVGAGVRAFDAREEQLVTSLAEGTAALADYDVRINALQNALTEGGLSANDAMVAEEELAIAREESAKQLEAELIQAESQRTASLDRINALEKQRTDFLEQADRASADRAEDRALADTFEAEDRELRYQSHLKNLESIELEGQAKIEDIRSALDSLPAERLKALGDAEQKANQNAADVQKEFMQSEIDRLKKFRVDEARIIQKANTDRIRAEQDFQDALNNAQRENDVIAFLQAQDQGKKELERTAQDLDEASKLRNADFVAETNARQEALSQRLLDIRKSFDQEKAQIEESFNVKRSELAKSIDEERDAIQARTEAAIASYDAELEAQARNDSRNAQREAIAEARRVRAHEEQLARIDEQTRAEQASLATILQTISSLQSNIGSTSASTTQTPAKRAVQGSVFSRMSTRNNLTAFADGGIVDKPTLALLGEGNYPEAIIPFSPSEGINKAVGRLGLGSSPVFAPQFNVQVGDIASKGEVSQALDSYTQTLFSNLATFLQTAQAGSRQ